MIALADLLQDFEKQVATPSGAEKWLALITATSDEVEVSGTVVAFETPGHGRRVGKLFWMCSEGGHGEMVTNRGRGGTAPCVEHRETWGTPGLGILRCRGLGVEIWATRHDHTAVDARFAGVVSIPKAQVRLHRGNPHSSQRRA